MILTSFVSGSTGNCTFLSTGTENILVDCGLSARKIGEYLGKFRLEIKDLDGILLTHEHADHIKGLKRLISGYHIPVYCSYGTWKGLAAVTKDDYFLYQGKDSFHCISQDREFYLGNTLIHPFHTYHDTEEPLGFRFELEQGICGKDLNIAVLTDCGKYDDYIADRLKHLDALLIESNHDTDMLMNGNYPMFLKRRILSEFGHSSNEGCSKILREIWTPRLKEVILAHLSEENNDPDLAYRYVLEHVCCPELEISVAPKDGMSKVIRF